MRINVGGAMHAKNIQSPMFNDGQIHIAKWVRNALDLNDVSVGSSRPRFVGSNEPLFVGKPEANR